MEMSITNTERDKGALSDGRRCA